MNRNQNILRLAVSALLVAIGILIPLISPVKIYLGPAGSMTLASHVAIFLAMFISPATASAVAIGCTLGFLLTTPIPIALRALTHLVWAALGAWWLKKHPDVLYRPAQSAAFCVITALVHAILETVIIMILFFGTDLVADKGGLWLTVFLPVGVVTLFHSCVDYAIALLVWRPLRKLKSLRDIAAVH